MLLPADRPDEILLATNFGIIQSADGGGSWQWTCERPETSMSVLYGLGAPPAIASMEFRERALTVRVKPESANPGAADQLRPALAARHLSLETPDANTWLIRSTGASQSAATPSGAAP